MPASEVNPRAPLARGATEARALRLATKPLGPLERAHLQLRYHSVPWNEIVGAFGSQGPLLDIGCGPGLLAHLLAGAGFSGGYLGVDPDPRKIARARRWLGESPDRRFEVGSVEAAPEAGFLQVALLDVLYLVPPGQRACFLSRAACALASGGLLIVLTSGGGPRWKRGLDALQERLAVGLGITRGDAVAPCDGGEVAALLREAGLTDLIVRDVGRGYRHGFELVTARRPAPLTSPSGTSP